ncbi:hypothetical protein VW23_000495 [Devosia insulae DS-56]|uniref:Uncharacterized protein n=1 Tax=Devosia insulae DS-56 TaxID=1116389 RepID=A0A1E5XHN6_9HYPH|nr:hypothetical protein [Devosia insulae]OEO28107.1 hypothetical protein VW23_000495 [Devosia insulae DS-56]
MSTIEDLIPKILTSTEAHQLKWAQVKLGSGFEFNIEENTVTVWEWFDQDSSTSGYSIALKRSDGVTLDSYVADEYGPQYRDLVKIYRAARRQALGVDSVIDAIGRALDELPPF